MANQHNATPNFKKRKKIGAPPGTIFYTGTGRGGQTDISFYQYSPEIVIQENSLSIDAVLEKVNESFVNWINVNGLEDSVIVSKLGARFNIHSLALEDVTNVHQTPKFELFDNHIFFCMKMLSFNTGSGRIEKEHISFLLGNSCLLSFQERKGDLFDPVRERITSTKGSLKQKGIDYLFYCLIDLVVDNYYLIIDNLNDRIYDLEDAILKEGNKNVVARIQYLKKQVSTFRKAIVPLRDALIRMNRGEEDDLISVKTLNYFNDIIDHVNYLMESTSTSREVLNSCMELHMANLSKGMNNVMKTLTIISTIFIPLTFIAGVYGMNFKYMPELQSKNGYFIVLILMALVGAVMVIYMKRKHWF